MKRDEDIGFGAWVGGGEPAGVVESDGRSVMLVRIDRGRALKVVVLCVGLDEMSSSSFESSRPIKSASRSN